VKNRLFIFINWMTNYLTYKNDLRLIIRPKLPKNVMAAMEEEMTNHAEPNKA